LIMASAFASILIYAIDLVPQRVGLVGGLFYGLAFGLGGLTAAARPARRSIRYRCSVQALLLAASPGTADVSAASDVIKPLKQVHGPSDRAEFEWIAPDGRMVDHSDRSRSKADLLPISPAIQKPTFARTQSETVFCVADHVRCAGRVNALTTNWPTSDDACLVG